jgi:hypothetical protein
MINWKPLLVFSMVVLLAGCEEAGLFGPKNLCAPVGQACPDPNSKTICWYKYKISQVIDEQKGQFKGIYTNGVFKVTKKEHKAKDEEYINDKNRFPPEGLRKYEWPVTLSPVPATGTVKQGHAYLFGNLCPSNTYELFQEINEEHDT